jgi:hypothetical protein
MGNATNKRKTMLIHLYDDYIMNGVPKTVSLKERTGPYLAYKYLAEKGFIDFQQTGNGEYQVSMLPAGIDVVKKIHRTIPGFV